MRYAVGRRSTAVLAVLAATCGTPTNPGPVVVDPPGIQSVTPATGPVSGGTTITIRGVRFASGAAVTIGGRAATDVVVQGADVITAKTPTGSTADTVDVAVTVNGRTATLAAGFRYEAAATNTAPVIKSISVQGTRPGEPPNFADLGETIRITGVVEDAETAPVNLTFEWKATCGGVFSGTGAQIQWQVPAAATAPQACTIDLTVIDGAHRVSSSAPVRVHDSPREMRNLALLFLTEFANSTIPAATTVRNFSDSCKGKADELKDVADNRARYVINEYKYGEPSTTIAFGGVCVVSSTRIRSGVDACTKTPAEWRSTIKESQKAELAVGTSYITGVYRESRWWLCDSDFQGTTSSGLTFMH